MAILTKGVDFTTGDQVSAANFDNLVDAAAFASGAVDNSTTALSSGVIIVKDAGITSSKLATNIAVAGTFSAGGAVDFSGAAAGQIAFPATQNASAGANTLDDYEEGTWTPSVGGTATYTAQEGSYTKVGRLVHVRGRLAINVIGTGSTTVISGLPFAAGTTTAGSVAYFVSIAVSSVFVGIYATTGSTLQFANLTAAGTSMTNTAALMGSSSDIYFTVVYSV